MQVISNLTNEEFCVRFRNWFDKQVLLFGWKGKSGAPGSFWHRNYVLERTFKNDYESVDSQGEMTYQRFLSSQANPLVELAQKVSIEYFNGLPLTRLWANVQTFGDESALHRDYPEEYRGQSKSLIWYPVNTWDPEWGGDIALFDEKKEIIASSCIQRDRAILFDGTTIHAARPMSRYCNIPRIAIAFGREVVE